MRTIVDLPDADLAALDAEAKLAKTSRAQVLRGAVNEYLARRRRASMQKHFGSWKDRKDIGDGLDYQLRIRAEWDHRP